MKLTEMPLNKIATRRGEGKPAYNNEKRLKWFTPTLRSKIKKHLDGVDVDINFYVVARHNTNQRLGSLDTYNELKLSDVKTLFGDQLGSEILKSHTPTSITIIAHKIDTPTATNKAKVNAFDTHFSWWSIIHDMVHGITIPNYKISKMFDKVGGSPPNYRGAMMPSIKALFERYGQDMAGPLEMLQACCTFKSARDGHRRLEELSTEMMTQYLTNPNGLVLQVPDFVPREDRKDCRAILKQIKTDVESIFEQVLAHAKGHIFSTTL